jgi:hypothetical protein
MNQKRYLGIATAVLAAAYGGAAMAQTLPGLVHSGTSPQSSAALVTLAIPSVVGVNVGHNFVLDFNSGTTCWGTTGAATFPQAPSGTTTYKFAVNSASIASTGVNVACPGAGAQPEVATVQVFSNMTGATGHLQVSITDGGGGAQATTFSGLIPDIFTGTRLKLTKISGTCGGGTVPASYNMTTSPADYVTLIPPTGWSDCNQTLSLTLDAGTLVAAGTATGTLTFTMIHP